MSKNTTYTHILIDEQFPNSKFTVVQHTLPEQYAIINKGEIKHPDQVRQMQQDLPNAQVHIDCAHRGSHLQAAAQNYKWNLVKFSSGQFPYIEAINQLTQLKESATNPHTWEAPDLSTCSQCGDKDWMASPSCPGAKSEPLFCVWIETNCGHISPPDWEINSHPKPIAEVVQESLKTSQQAFPTMILPEGITPREDGLFSNPDTDPDKKTKAEFKLPAGSESVTLEPGFAVICTGPQASGKTLFAEGLAKLYGSYISTSLEEAEQHSSYDTVIIEAFDPTPDNLTKAKHLVNNSKHCFIFTSQSEIPAFPGDKHFTIISFLHKDIEDPKQEEITELENRKKSLELQQKMMQNTHAIITLQQQLVEAMYDTDMDFSLTIINSIQSAYGGLSRMITTAKENNLELYNPDVQPFEAVGS